MAGPSPLAATFLAAAVIHFAIALFVLFSGPRRLANVLVTVLLTLSGGSALARAQFLMAGPSVAASSPNYLTTVDLEWGLSFIVLGLALVYPRRILRGTRGRAILGGMGLLVAALWLAVILDKGLLYADGLEPTWASTTLDDARYFLTLGAALAIFAFAYLERPVDSPDRSAEYLFIAFSLAPIAGSVPTLGSRFTHDVLADVPALIRTRALIGTLGTLAILALYVGTIVLARRRGHRTTPLVAWGLFALALPLGGRFLPSEYVAATGPFGELAYLLVRPALVGYAILRHQLFDIDVRVKRGFTAVLLVVAIAALFLPVEELVRRGSGLPSDFALAAGISVGLAVSLVLYTRLEEFAHGASGRIFSRVREDEGAYLAQRKREIYRSVLERSLDTRLNLSRATDDLTKLRASLGIADEEHEAMLAQVRAAALRTPVATGPAAPGTLLAGRYRVTSVLGHGASGTTYRCHDDILHRDVAVKEIDLGGGQHAAQARRRAINEARRLAAVRHAHVVTLLDVHESPAHAFLVMELMVGGSLAQRLAGGPLAAEDARKVTLDVLQGLEALHAAGIVHRDVKPSNVLLDDAGRAKLADLGVSLGGGSETVSGLGARGTPLYMSPEQALDLPVDARADIFATGNLLYEMLVGEPPARTKSREGILVAEAIVSAPPPLPLQDAPSWANGFLARALAKEPDGRYASARDAADALRPGTVTRDAAAGREEASDPPSGRHPSTA